MQENAFQRVRNQKFSGGPCPRTHLDGSSSSAEAISCYCELCHTHMSSSLTGLVAA